MFSMRALKARERRPDSEHLEKMSPDATPPNASPDDRATMTGATPAALARDVIQSFLAQRWDRLETLLHPDAQLETGFSLPGARFAKKEVLDAGWVAAKSGAYKPEYQLVESLDDSTALVGVRLRYEIGKGLFSERDAAYLMRFDDGLLRETRVFESVEDAIDAHRQGRPQPS
jgi:hypothetical protein